MNFELPTVLVETLGYILTNCMNIVYEYITEKPKHTLDFGNVVCMISLNINYVFDLEVKQMCKINHRFDITFFGNIHLEKHVNTYRHIN